MSKEKKKITALENTLEKLQIQLFGNNEDPRLKIIKQETINKIKKINEDTKLTKQEKQVELNKIINQHKDNIIKLAIKNMVKKNKKK